jgi:hypothetical protein
MGMLYCSEPGSDLIPKVGTDPESDSDLVPKNRNR